MLLLASGLVSVAMGQYDDAVSITVVSIEAVVRLLSPKVFARSRIMWKRKISARAIVESKKTSWGKPSTFQR